MRDLVSSQHLPVELGPADAARIARLERRCFIPPLQASEEQIRQRLALGHTMLGIAAGADLVGMLAFRFGTFDPADFASFPKTFDELCLQPSRRGNTIFLYNLEVEPTRRGTLCAKRLAYFAFKMAFLSRCTFGVANCRVAAYRGADPRFSQERTKPKARLRRAIDEHLAGGPLPAQEVFRDDPTLALYHRLTECRFQWVIPDFAPSDHATRGLRVIAYGRFDRAARQRFRALSWVNRER
ncbi:MAG: hypothetical protein AAF628_34235 [Planctomycetota bacterium]